MEAQANSLLSPITAAADRSESTTTLVAKVSFTDSLASSWAANLARLGRNLGGPASMAGRHHYLISSSVTDCNLSPAEPESDWPGGTRAGRTTVYISRGGYRVRNFIRYAIIMTSTSKSNKRRAV